jgi:hypothetical protein
VFAICGEHAVELGVPGVIKSCEGAGHTGFELGLRSMRVGGKRRLVVPPQLGPPTGPATFFSAKQCEVRYAHYALRQCLGTGQYLLLNRYEYRCNS